MGEKTNKEYAEELRALANKIEKEDDESKKDIMDQTVGAAAETMMKGVDAFADGLGWLIGAKK